MATNNRENSNFYEIAITDAGGGNVFDIDVPGNVTVGGVSTFSNIGNIRISGGGNGQVISTDGASNLSWITPAANVNAAGLNTQIQYNNGGLMAASNRFTYSNGLVTTANANITSNLTVTGNSNVGNVGNLKITGGTGGQILSTDGAGNLSWVSAGSSTNQAVESRNASISGFSYATWNTLGFSTFIKNGAAIPGLSYNTTTKKWTNNSGATMYLWASCSLEVSSSGGGAFYVRVLEQGAEVYRASTNAPSVSSTASRLTVAGIVKLDALQTLEFQGYLANGPDLGVFGSCTIGLIAS